MTVLAHRNGSWINQYAQPGYQVFIQRGRQTGYVVIKYGMKTYEVTAHQFSIPWLAERMAESGTDSQNGPSQAVRYGTELANQANQPGCIGAVLNLEERDGGWHTDDGWGTLRLISTFRTLAPGKLLFASLDTRGNRPNYPYQRACAALCDGVMPMVYPGAFGQRADIAFKSAITPLLRERWAGKEIIPTFQTYSPPEVDVPAEIVEIQKLYAAGIIQGANSYTLGHATPAQWQASLAFDPAVPQLTPPLPDVAGALVRLRRIWVDGWHAIEQNGTPSEAVAFADFWQKLVGETPIVK